jgi:GNAT superfamily N-acetyltransferase
MKTTRFLFEHEYSQYADWLKSQDEEAKDLFFGYRITDESIDKLVSKFVADPTNHQFLVVERNDKWIGTLHIAIVGDEVEFGLMVSKDYRGKGVASILMSEGLLWSSNRGFKEVCMHCLTRNKPIQYLCHKHGLKTTNMFGDSGTKMPLPQPTPSSHMHELANRQRQLWRTVLKNTFPIVDKIYE